MLEYMSFLYPDFPQKLVFNEKQIKFGNKEFLFLPQEIYLFLP